MWSELSSLPMPVVAIIASGIGAIATVTAALINLRIAWRKEMQARAEHKPITKKGKRGPVGAIFVLMMASAVGGFALSHYFTSKDREKTEMLEQELREQLKQLSLSTQRLENMRMLGESDMMRAYQSRQAIRDGAEGVEAMVRIGKCVVTFGATAAESMPCNPSHAMRLDLCAQIPLNANVTSIDLFARVDDKPWSDSRVVADEDFGGGRFDDKFREQPLDEMQKHVCQTISYWRHESDMQARMVIHYVPVESDAVPEVRPVEPAAAASALNIDAAPR